MLLTYTGQLPQILPNPVKNLAGAGLGRICQKWLDAGPAGAEIRYIPKLHEHYNANVSELISVKCTADIQKYIQKLLLLHGKNYQQS